MTWDFDGSSAAAVMNDLPPASIATTWRRPSTNDEHFSGSSAMIRLHPIQPDRWRDLAEGAGILLCKVSDPRTPRFRYLGLAEVLQIST
jgi:hypothetical protein